jgi:hypothetical protein
MPDSMCVCVCVEDREQEWLSSPTPLRCTPLSSHRTLRSACTMLSECSSIMPAATSIAVSITALRVNGGSGEVGLKQIEECRGQWRGRRGGLKQIEECRGQWRGRRGGLKQIEECRGQHGRVAILREA